MYIFFLWQPTLKTKLDLIYLTKAIERNKWDVVSNI